MEFRILGTLEALAGGRELPLGGARQRAVLAILLLHRGEAVSVDRVVDELWGARSPETATKTVQVYVSRLRKVLGEGVLVTRGGGYALEAPAEDVDADRFERLASGGREALDRADPTEAADRLRAALSLWRGPPLADLACASAAAARRVVCRKRILPGATTDAGEAVGGRPENLSRSAPPARQ
jgi:DNA-binding SARP family transcriptional activator